MTPHPTDDDDRDATRRADRANGEPDATEPDDDVMRRADRANGEPDATEPDDGR